MWKVRLSRVLVTGGAGFIGSHLVDRLRGLGCFVRVADNLSNGSLENIT
jgi:nucleoside-diphosphate-sugar epimerase